MFITKYHKNINMTGATSGAGTPYPSLSQHVLMYITHVNEVHTFTIYYHTSKTLTRQVPLVEQELLTLLEHLSSPPVF